MVEGDIIYSFLFLQKNACLGKNKWKSRKMRESWQVWLESLQCPPGLAAEFAVSAEVQRRL